MNRLLSLERSVSGKRKTSSLSRQSSKVRRKPLSRPFFDTGEHILFGENLQDLPHFQGSILSQAGRKFALGQASGSGGRQEFSYGDIVACGDFYEDFAEMNRAPQNQLRALHRLLRQSEAFYRRNVGNPGNVGSGPGIDWSGTVPEYVDLALKNFTHFAPPNAALVPITPASGERAGTHKSAWEHYHLQAANIVRQGRDSTAIHEALPVNAFADHFLTDAFSTGHLFNKHDFSAQFTARAYSGNSLSSAGEEFVEKVAEQAFTGPLKRAFRDYDFVGRNASGFLRRLFGRVNIRTETQFKMFLKGVAEARGRKNMLGDSIVAKALHDDLNNYNGGIAVTNQAGDRWQLTGDGTLNRSSLRIVHKAVAQSIYNIVHEVANDVSDANLPALVWRFVPQPTAASVRIISTMAREYSNPTNTRVISRAVEILKSEYQVLLDKAVTDGELRHDP